MRKPIYNEPMSRVFNFRLQESVFKKMEAHAKQEHRPISTMGRMVLEDYYANWKPENKKL